MMCSGWVKAPMCNLQKEKLGFCPKPEALKVMEELVGEICLPELCVGGFFVVFRLFL